MRWNALGIVHPHIPSAGLYSDSVARYTAFKLKGGPPPKCCRVITYLPRAVTYLFTLFIIFTSPGRRPGTQLGIAAREFTLYFRRKFRRRTRKRRRRRRRRGGEGEGEGGGFISNIIQSTGDFCKYVEGERAAATTPLIPPIRPFIPFDPTQSHPIINSHQEDRN